MKKLIIFGFIFLNGCYSPSTFLMLTISQEPDSNLKSREDIVASMSDQIPHLSNLPRLDRNGNHLYAIRNKSYFYLVSIEPGKIILWEESLQERDYKMTSFKGEASKELIDTLYRILNGNSENVNIEGPTRQWGVWID